MKRLAFLSVLLMTLFSGAYAAAQGTSASSQSRKTRFTVDSNFVLGSVVVVLKEGFSKLAPSTRNGAIEKAQDLDIIRSPRNSRSTYVPSAKKHLLLTLKDKDKQSVIDYIDDLLNREEVYDAYPDIIMTLSAVSPNDPKSWEQYAIQMMDLPFAWMKTKGSPSVTVGIVDTGAYLDHEDLAANLWVNPGEIRGNGIDDDRNGLVDDVNGWNFGGGSSDIGNNDLTDHKGHGTHVAGIVAAVGNNGVGVTGVTWNSKVAILKTANDGGDVAFSRVYMAVNYARAMGIPILNMSFTTTDYLQDLYDVMDNEILYACAAGNGVASHPVDVDLCPHYPASFILDNIISVANVDQTGALSNNSNYARYSVDIAAPGAGILSTSFSGGYELKDGTSMSAPQVAGAAALLKAYKPQYTAMELKHTLMSTAGYTPSLSERTNSSGIVNVNKALDVLPLVGIRARFNGNFTYHDRSYNVRIGSGTALPSRNETFEMVKVSTNRIRLRSMFTGDYLSVITTSPYYLKSTKVTPGNYETFDIVGQTDGSVALKCVGNSKYVTAPGNGAILAAGKTTVGAYEKFDLVARVALKSYSHVSFLQPDPATSNTVVAGNGYIKTSENLVQMHFLGTEKVAVKSDLNNMFYTVNNTDKRVYASKSTIGTAETFTLSKRTYGNYSNYFNIRSNSQSKYIAPTDRNYLSAEQSTATLDNSFQIYYIQ